MTAPIIITLDSSDTMQLEKDKNIRDHTNKQIMPAIKNTTTAAATTASATAATATTRRPSDDKRKKKKTKKSSSANKNTISREKASLNKKDKTNKSDLEERKKKRKKSSKPKKKNPTATSSIKAIAEDVTSDIARTENNDVGKKTKGKKTKAKGSKNTEQSKNALVDPGNGISNNDGWATTLKDTDTENNDKKYKKEEKIKKKTKKNKEQQGRRYSFGSLGSNRSIAPIDLDVDYGYEDAAPDDKEFKGNERRRSSIGRSLARRRLTLRASINSVQSFLSTVFVGNTERKRSNSRIIAFGYTGRESNFRISKEAAVMKGERVEAFFYNHGMELALLILYVALNILVGAHGAYQFTTHGGWTTDNDILRVTLPIARAGGRLVSLNCALLLLTACKWTWTFIRERIAPVIPIGFPIDNVMPKYHRYVALNVIVWGCVVHTLPQIVNYASGAIVIDDGGWDRIWTYGNGFATKQLLVTGTLLTAIFSTFFVTTLQAFRKTAAGFRWFWFFHMGGISLGYPLLIVHGTCKGHPIFMYFALFPLILYIFDIFMRRSKVLSTKVLKWETHEDNHGQHITELVLECPGNFDYTPGQYAELKFAPISTSEFHPFTIASAPNDGCGKIDNNDVQEIIKEYGNSRKLSSTSIGIAKDILGENNKRKKKEITFYIKSTGRWTEALYDYASAFDLTKAKKKPEFLIRGPHGAPAMNYFEYRHLVVIGSGVGVTPLLSIWKYLVQQGQMMVQSRKTSTTSLAETIEESIKNTHQLKDSTSYYGVDPLKIDNGSGDSEDDKFESKNCPSKMKSTCTFLENILESMTVSMVLFLLFVSGETITIVMQMFGFGRYANGFGALLSFIALIVHSTTITVSTIALGHHYIKHFKCWLELSIIIVDCFALYLSFKILLFSNNEEDLTDNAYFILFGIVVALHALRIFHIFYSTLKPAKNNYITNTTNDKNEIHSIQGILINRYYSGMKFAAKSLLPPIEDSLSRTFSMEFYGTREKAADYETDEDEEALISDMVGSKELKIDREQDNVNFIAGRPDWQIIFRKALAKAHYTNTEGESVGVFFCGAPAISKDLQKLASEVTAQHQYAHKHLDGKPCKCKLIVHTENF